MFFVPGNYEVNECKADRLVPGFTPLTDEEMIKAGLTKGSIGPVGLPEGVKVAADESLRSIERWVVGANDDGFHFVGAKHGEDFQVDAWADLCTVKEGDACPHCGLPLKAARGIEVGQIFKLGDKYSKAMGATFMDEDGSEKPFMMGCYGVGVSRTMAAAVEQSYDDFGIICRLALLRRMCASSRCLRSPTRSPRPQRSLPRSFLLPATKWSLTTATSVRVSSSPTTTLSAGLSRLSWASAD